MYIKNITDYHLKMPDKIGKQKYNNIDKDGNSTENSRKKFWKQNNYEDVVIEKDLNRKKKSLNISKKLPSKIFKQTKSMKF